MSHGNHDQLRLGFLTAVEDAERGFVGGLLVTNRYGRPLEFQCTSPVKPNRTQQILYGPTLKPYVLGELIGRTLLEKVGVKPHLVLIELPELLDLRTATSIPVGGVFSKPSENSGKQQAGNGSADSVKLGHEMIALHSSHHEDRHEIEKFAKLVPGDADLTEPFDRIREALIETVRLAMSRPA